MSLKDVFENQVDNLIHDFGQSVTVVWGSTANCSSCGYDPINKEATNVSCDTCNGQFWYQTENTLKILGIVRTFVGNLKYTDYSLKPHGFIPEHEARLTCWLTDVLVNDCSATGLSYLDVPKNVRVESSEKKYKVNSTFRSGVDKLKVIIATLEEIKN